MSCYEDSIARLMISHPSPGTARVCRLLTGLHSMDAFGKKLNINADIKGPLKNSEVREVIMIN